LQLGELVELRQDINFVHDFYFKDFERFKGITGGDNHTICPDDEAAIMFMNRNYGTQIYNFVECIGKLSYDRWELINLMGFDYYQKYFKRIQEEMHLL
jgi:hypothetical protein